MQSGDVTPEDSTSAPPEVDGPLSSQRSVAGSGPKDNETTPHPEAKSVAEHSPSSQEPQKSVRSESNSDTGLLPRVTFRSDSQEDPADPIEPADDLVDYIEPPAQDDDPIEQGSSIRESPPKAPVVKGMKDRAGQTTSQGARGPVLASLEIQSTVAQQARPKRTKKKDENPAVSQPEKANPPVPASTPAPSQKPPSAALMPPPAAITSTSEPKRRGRPPITQEEKEKREAAKQAGKAEKAAARAAAKAEKEAKKLAKNAEKTKSGRKAPAKPRGSSSTNTAKVGQAPTPDPAEVPSSHSVGPSSVQAAEITATPQNPPPLASQGSVKWTILTQSETPEPASSVIDELRSSSPPVSVDLPARPAAMLPKPKTSQRRVNGTSAQPIPSLIPLPPTPSQLLTPVRPNDPLFLPGTQSQFPNTSMDIHTRNSSQPIPSSPLDTERTKGRRPPTKPATTHARFRTLTELSSQILFSPPDISSTPVSRSMPTKPNNVTQDDSDEEVSESSSDDSDSDSDDGSDNPSSNHIPSSRRAGASITKNKKGFLSGIA